MTNAPETKRILLVDDEPDILESLEEFLSSEGYEVHKASNGKEALEKIQSNDFSVVISDVRMPEMNGVEVLAWILTNKPQVRTILMTGFADIKETLDASALGVRGFLMKPFKLDELLRTVENSLKQVNVAVAEFDTTKFGSVSIDGYQPSSKNNFKLYIKLVDGKFLKICEADDHIPIDRLTYLKTKGIFNLWLEKEDFNKYLAFQKSLMQKAFGSKDVTAEKKIQIMRTVCEIHTENLKFVGIDKQTLSEIMAIWESSLDYFLRLETNSLVINVLETVNKSTSSHMVACGVLAGVLSKVIGWSSKKSLQILIFSGYIHDVGMLQLSEEILNTPYAKMTKEQKAEYEQHPVKAAQLASEMESLPGEVKTISLQHHENPKATGYPQGLARVDIFPMSRLIVLIDVFLEEIEKVDYAHRKNKLADILDKVVAKDPLIYEKRDVLAMKYAITETDLRKAQIKLEKDA